MGNIKNIYFDWNRAGSCQVRQYDHLSNRVIFGNAPKFENYYLLVAMKESESDEQAKEMSPIQLTSPVWLIPNSYTQMVQQIKFQICNQAADGSFEQHSAEYTIDVLKSHDHEGEDIDVDPSPMYDAYKEYVDDRIEELIDEAGGISVDTREYVDEKIQTMIAAAGDVAIDTTLSVSGAAADAKATGDAIGETNERLEDLEKSAGGILYEQSGTSVEVNLSDTLDGIKHLTVAGKTEQEGTPELDNPADIVGLGDLDSTTGTYTVTVPVIDSGGVVHNIVATGLAYPLYDGDTLDLVTGEIDRKNGQIIFDGTQQPRAGSISQFTVNPKSGAYNLAVTNRLPYSSSSSSVNTFGGNASSSNYIVLRLGASTAEEELAILANKPVQFVYKLHSLELPYTEQVTVTGIDAVNELTGVVTINSETMLTAKWAIDAKSYIDDADSALDSRVSANAVGVVHLAEGSFPVTELGEFVVGSWFNFNDKRSSPYNKCCCKEKLSLPTDAFIKCDPGYKLDLCTASQSLSNNVHAVVKAGELFVINVSGIASGPPAIEDPAETASHVRIYSPITSEYNRLYESFAGFEMFNSIGFVGDSYTVNAPNGISWGKVIERRLGIDVGVYGHSGYSSSSFIRNGLLDTMLADNLRELYWIEFVINDSSRYNDEPAYLGSESDVSGEDYTAYPDTLWGNYGHIIEAILAANPSAKIVLCKGTFANLRTAQIDTGVTDIPAVNAELDDIGAHYGIPVVNPLDDMFYWSMIFTGSMSSNHPKALGMPGIANAKMRMFSRCVQDNISYFYA